MDFADGKLNPCPAHRDAMVDDEGREVELILVAGGLVFRHEGAKLIGLDAAGLEALYARLGQL
jgi:hypothetical protein